jgi:hypothetical protein
LLLIIVCPVIVIGRLMKLGYVDKVVGWLQKKDEEVNVRYLELKENLLVPGLQLCN